MAVTLLRDTTCKAVSVFYVLHTCTNQPPLQALCVRGLGGKMASPAAPGTQVWLGNIPHSFDEHSLLEELAVYGIVPWRCNLVRRQEPLDLCSLVLAINDHITCH